MIQQRPCANLYKDSYRVFSSYLQTSDTQRPGQMNETFNLGSGNLKLVLAVKVYHGMFWSITLLSLFIYLLG